jgi:hypothetical protein
MGDDKKLINLKEAAKISGYSADYIGQLIRAGKISGKQVYCNIAWMTTAEAVLNYKKNEVKKGKKKKVGGYFVIKKQKFIMQAEIIKLFFQTFKLAWSLLIILILSFLFLNVFIFYYLNKQTSPAQSNESLEKQIEQPLSF